MIERIGILITELIVLIAFIGLMLSFTYLFLSPLIFLGFWVFGDLNTFYLITGKLFLIGYLLLTSFIFITILAEKRKFY